MGYFVPHLLATLTHQAPHLKAHIFQTRLCSYKAHTPTAHVSQDTYDELTTDVTQK